MKDDTVLPVLAALSVILLAGCTSLPGGGSTTETPPPSGLVVEQSSLEHSSLPIGGATEYTIRLTNTQPQPVRAVDIELANTGGLETAIVSAKTDDACQTAASDGEQAEIPPARGGTPTEVLCVWEISAPTGQNGVIPGDYPISATISYRNSLQMQRESPKITFDPEQQLPSSEVTRSYGNREVSMDVSFRPRLPSGASVPVSVSIQNAGSGRIGTLDLDGLPGGCDSIRCVKLSYAGSIMRTTDNPYVPLQGSSSQSREEVCGTVRLFEGERSGTAECQLTGADTDTPTTHSLRVSADYRYEKTVQTPITVQGETGATGALSGCRQQCEDWSPPDDVDSACGLEREGISCGETEQLQTRSCSADTDCSTQRCQEVTTCLDTLDIVAIPFYYDQDSIDRFRRNMRISVFGGGEYDGFANKGPFRGIDADERINLVMPSDSWTEFDGPQPREGEDNPRPRDIQQAAVEQYRQSDLPERVNGEPDILVVKVNRPIRLYISVDEEDLPDRVPDGAAQALKLPSGSADAPDVNGIPVVVLGDNQVYEKRDQISKFYGEVPEALGGEQVLCHNQGVGAGQFGCLDITPQELKGKERSSSCSNDPESMGASAMMNYCEPREQFSADEMQVLWDFYLDQRWVHPSECEQADDCTL